MLYDCKFNPLSDVEEVVPDLAPDISEMMVTHTVPATQSVDTPYTNEDDVDKVGHYLRDTIDVAIAKMRMDVSLAKDSSVPSESGQPAPQAE